MLLKVGIALVAAAAVAAIAAVILWDGPDRDREVEYRVVNEEGSGAEDPGLVVVADGDRDGPRFFPVFPVLLIGGAIVAFAVFSRRHGGWGDPHNRFEEWHRQAHGNGPPATAGS